MCSLAGGVTTVIPAAQACVSQSSVDTTSELGEMPELDFSKMWVAWLAAFLVIEGIAIFNKRSGDTLSEHVWKWVPYKSGRWVVLGGFLAWLSYHFLLDNPY